MTQRLTIVGPNLPAQAKAPFHVHAAGCTDLKRGWIRSYAAEAWDMDASSRYDVEASVYDFAADEDPHYSLGDYQSEFWFAPCVTLPLGAGVKPGELAAFLNQTPDEREAQARAEVEASNEGVAVGVGDYAGRVLVAQDEADDERHQGYANYETFAVAVRIDNDRDLRALAYSIVDEATTYSIADGTTYSIDQRIEVADRLRDWHEDTMPELDSPYAELLAAGFGAVDWLELADQYIAEVKEQSMSEGPVEEQMEITNTAVNDLINHIDRVASRLDAEVYEVALDTGLTERAEIIAGYDARQRLVRRMVRVSHELNSLLTDTGSIPVDRQPTEYGNPHDGSA